MRVKKEPRTAVKPSEAISQKAVLPVQQNRNEEQHGTVALVTTQVKEKHDVFSDKAVENEIRGIINAINKYTTQTRHGNWLKLRRGVLGDKMGLWIDRKNSFIDLACIEDALGFG
jgi:hypothetical protein